MADHLLIFVPAALGITLAGMLGHSAEHLTAHVGTGLDGFLNASLGNAAEHFTAVMVVVKGRVDLALGIEVGLGL